MKSARAIFLGGVVLVAGVLGLAEERNAAAEVDALFRATLSSEGRAATWLQELVEGYPGRFSGSVALTGAETWAEAQFRALGVDRVYRQETQAPSWSRGTRCEVTVSLDGGDRIKFAALAVGGSIATPAEGIMAGLVEVRSLGELEALDAETAKDRLIFCNVALDPTLPDVQVAYAKTADIRRRAAGIAGKLGARGVLIRSLTPRIDDAPHTGSMVYPAGEGRVPAASLSTLAAEKLSALLRAHAELQVKFIMDCGPLPDAPVANIIAEITGSENPEEIIVVSAHLDSWDVSPGAHDDGAGVAHVLETFRLFKALDRRPRHTVRAVLFTNEEFGKAGSIRYVTAMKAAGEKHLIAIESDHGGFTPRGYVLASLRGDAPQRAARWKPLLEKYGLHRFEEGEGGPDLRLLYPLGVPVAGLIIDSNRYFDLHHTTQDTLDKVHPRELALGAGALAALVWLVDQEGL